MDYLYSLFVLPTGLFWVCALAVLVCSVPVWLTMLVYFNHRYKRDMDALSNQVSQSLANLTDEIED